MRSVLGIVIVGVLASLLSGCAQQSTAIMVKPSPDESPRLDELQPLPNSMTVRVPGRDEQPLVTLTPTFKEPELTPAERAALGQDLNPYKPLLYALPYRQPGQTVGNFDGGQSVATWGHGGSVGAIEPTPTKYATGHWGGQAVGVIHWSATSAAVGPLRSGAQRIGPWEQQTTAVEAAAQKARKSSLAD